jgi:predicted transcriptional regulator
MLFEKHQKYMQKVLSAIEKHPLRWKELQPIWVNSGSNPAQFVKCMRWMREKGYIKKTDPANRFSTYEITENGKKYLEGLKA